MIEPIINQMAIEDFDFTSQLLEKKPKVVFCFDEANALLPYLKLGFLSTKPMIPRNPG
jgi:hypothetical protein